MFTIKDLEQLKNSGKMKQREFTAGEITKHALEVLNLQGFEVWRSNNIPVRGRAFIGRRGASDIQGFKRPGGAFLACEVKKIGDTLKKDQIEFLGAVKASGGYAFIARQEGSQIVIEPFNQ